MPGKTTLIENEEEVEEEEKASGRKLCEKFGYCPREWERKESR